MGDEPIGSSREGRGADAVNFCAFRVRQSILDIDTEIPNRVSILV
jgi:hypothetical protein